MTFQGCCQLYCYSKDPVMNSMNVPLNWKHGILVYHVCAICLCMVKTWLTMFSLCHGQNMVYHGNSGIPCLCYLSVLSVCAWSKHGWPCSHCVMVRKWYIMLIVVYHVCVICLCHGQNMVDHVLNIICHGPKMVYHVHTMYDCVICLCMVKTWLTIFSSYLTVFSVMFQKW